MKREESIRKAFKFLTKHAKSGSLFSISQFSTSSGWSPYYTETNLTKRLSDLVLRVDDKLLANPEILRVRYQDFQDLFRQKHRLFTDYVLVESPQVLIYEFFMPLAREDRLREALDNLFFLDTVRQCVDEIGYPTIRQKLSLPATTTNDETLHLVTDFVEDTISGYSLYLVSGRFRSGPLSSRSCVTTRSFSEGPYLVDETTAVVRFILPVSTGSEVIQTNLFPGAEIATELSVRAEQMRWLFLKIFAEAVTRVVHKEDEIWLVESGMKSALYRWPRSSGE